MVDVVVPQGLGGLQDGVGLAEDRQSGLEVWTQVGLGPLLGLGLAPAEVGQLLLLVDHGRVEHDGVAEDVELGPDEQLGSAEGPHGQPLIVVDNRPAPVGPILRWP